MPGGSDVPQALAANRRCHGGRFQRDRRQGLSGLGLHHPFKKPQGGKLLDWQKEFNAQVNRLRAPVERAIAHLKSWRILHTDYRRPLRTYATSYRAAVGLYFFKLSFG